MCQMSVVLEKDGGQEMVMKSVARLEVLADGVRVSALFEEPVVVAARVKTIDFMAGLVTMEPLAGMAGGQE